MNQLGHNQPKGRVYAIIIDFDTEILKQTYPGQSWTNAYVDVRNYLTTQGFEWKYGGIYFGDDTIDAVKCVLVVQRMAKKFPWFKGAVRDLRGLRVEESSNLYEILNDHPQ